jgi:segregation and condensation protein B
MTRQDIKRILEALLLVSEKPLLVDRVREVLQEADVTPSQIRDLLRELMEEYASHQRGIRIVEVADGFQMVTAPECATYVTRLTRRTRTVRLSRPALETLAIVAYRQPITRAEVEEIRGVDVAGVLETLLKLNFIRVVGRKEVVGRPLLYGTTREFLEHFGLKNLEALPKLEELGVGIQRSASETAQAD